MSRLKYIELSNFRFLQAFPQQVIEKSQLIGYEPATIIGTKKLQRPEYGIEKVGSTAKKLVNNKVIMI